MKSTRFGLKRGLSLLLALTLLLAALPLSALAEDVEELPEEELVPRELRVVNPTAMSGNFFNKIFGNNTSDIDVRALIHGYNLVDWDQEQGVYEIDPSVVSRVMETRDDQGNRTYFIALHEDLYYSDGTPITAWDYAFSLLLSVSPELEEIGGMIYRAAHILGAEQYIRGESSTLGGVEVLNDYQLAITLDHEFLPFFFEVGLLLCNPYPIQVIAPGCKVYDDGNGVYIDNEDRTIPQRLFTAELLRETMLDPETGYISHPSVVSGPYTLTEYDGVTAHFERNPYFKGDAHGKVPQIERISLSVADSDTVIQQIVDGEIDLVNKLSEGEAIREGLMAGSDAGLRFSNYPRVGLTHVTFSYERPTVHEKEVRQAIAWCMDRDALTNAYCQGMGLRVDGYFGIQQWEYMLLKGQLDYPVDRDPEHPLSDAEYDRAMAEWEELTLDGLTEYHVDTGRANSLLNQAGWTLNRDGEAYRPGEDDVRCKWIDGELVALDLTMMYPEGNHIADYLQEYMIDHLNECGILLTLVPTEMTELLEAYYRQAPRDTDMVYLGTNFYIVVDPSISFSADPTPYHQLWNIIYSDDEELYQLAVDMRKTEPGDIYGYVKKWIAFQHRFNDVLPAIPVYSNIYYDFFTEELENYYIPAHVSWAQAILESTFATGEEPLEERVKIEEEEFFEDEEEEFLEDGEEFFEDDEEEYFFFDE